GYIEFIDDIGRYMEVKDIKGIRLAGTLYSGEALAKNFVPGGGNLGSVSEPNDLGNEMIWAVMERLGIDSLADAHQLVSLAYRSGQLSYNTETGQYSNYIGWYADNDGNFISHGEDDDTVYPEGAVFYNKSYGFTGAVADGYNSTDMMYVSVQVHTRIATGTQAVIFRVPAALIPVITYNVSFTGDTPEDPGEITLERDDKIWVDTVGNGTVDREVDVTPIRLVYEVGVRSDIDDITVHSIVDASYEHTEDGVYTFYTNRWDMEDIGLSNPSQAKNTVSFFSPSPENERYYYTQNTTVYELCDGEYIPYNADTAPVYESGRFFRAHNVYEYSDKVSGGNATVHTHYEEISGDTLSCAKRSDSGNWYIPKGTVYRYFEDHEHLKTENTTGTVPYSHYVNVEKVDGADEQDYYIDYILGNNGMTALKAAEGIKLSAMVDETMKGRTDTVSFEISAPDGSYRLVNYKNGKSESVLTVSSGKAVVALEDGTEVYIVDLPVGAEIGIRMLTEGKDYSGKGAESLTLTVEKAKITDVNFVTTLTPPADSGMLVLGCDVIHTLGGSADPKYHSFTFDVNYGDRSETVALHHGESVVIKDIPIGSEVTVTETDLPKGFTSDKKDDKISITVDKAGVFVAGFVNTYSPSAVSAKNIRLTANVKLTGREISANDSFAYKLEKLVGTEWVYMAESNAAMSAMTVDFTKYISAESFDSVGVYSYRIIPVIAENPHMGITYDKMSRWFEVMVADRDWNGSYEIYSIAGFNGGMVAKNDNAWELYTDFNSKYEAAGSDAVSIVADTLIEGNEELSLEGYLYGLYQNGSLVQTFPASDVNGEAVVILSYSAADIGNSIDYTVKQMIPDEPMSNMAYSDKEYKLTVKVEDDLMGNVKASIIFDGKTEREAKLTFINTYMPTVSDKETTDTDKIAKDTTTTAKQDNETKPNNTKPSTSPMTGDNGIVFWGLMLLASAAIIVIIISTKKRKTVN
ncbi:MAG: hypothetical protein IKU19_07875, partial [Clostridia bacterium]|nr:hypothetical protein [Clostridia bacterium]